MIVCLQYLRYRGLYPRADAGAQGGGRGDRVRGGDLRRGPAHRLQLRAVRHLHAPGGRLGRQERGGTQERGTVAPLLWGHLPYTVTFSES